MQKGYKHSAEARQKMRLAAYRRDNTSRIKALPRGEGHHSWSKRPNKLTLHKRIHRKYGAASKYLCVDCGGKARDWSNEGTYSDRIEDYKPRCRRCHIKKDGHSRNGIRVWESLHRSRDGRFLSSMKRSKKRALSRAHNTRGLSQYEEYKQMRRFRIDHETIL